MLLLTTLPEIKLNHLMSLTDDVGLLQHACFGIPYRDHGYSSDEVGRALAAIMRRYHQLKDAQILPLAGAYIGSRLSGGSLRGGFGDSQQVRIEIHAYMKLFQVAH